MAALHEQLHFLSDRIDVTLVQEFQGTQPQEWWKVRKSWVRDHSIQSVDGENSFVTLELRWSKKVVEPQTCTSYIFAILLMCLNCVILWQALWVYWIWCRVNVGTKLNWHLDYGTVSWITWPSCCISSDGYLLMKHWLEDTNTIMAYWPLEAFLLPSCRANSLLVWTTLQKRFYLSWLYSHMQSLKTWPYISLFISCSQYIQIT